MATPLNTVVTGDVVHDVHLYVAPADGATDPGRRGTVLMRRAGGALLTLELLRAAAAAADAAAKRPASSVRFDLDCDGAAGSQALPQHLHAYSVWSPFPPGPGGKDKVWRAAIEGGYGPGKLLAPTLARKIDAGTTPADVVLIDDGALYFRHAASAALWPDLDTARHVVLKTCAPLCRGELWVELLKRCADRLTVLVTADDLRRDDALVARRLSWESTAIDTLRVLKSHPVLAELQRAATVVVTYGSAGALCVHRQPGTKPRAVLLFHPSEMEGEHACAGEGVIEGKHAAQTAAVAHHLAEAADVGAAAADLQAVLHEGVARGLCAHRTAHDQGHGRIAGGEPAMPADALGAVVAAPARGLVQVDVPMDLADKDRSAEAAVWSILDAREPPPAPGKLPMAGLAMLLAREGLQAVADVPCLAVGKLFTVDRREIESLRTLKRLIEDYEAAKVQKKPLSLGVFGPPGAGKSFAVKAIAKQVLPEGALLEFNLSQFEAATDLIGALHQVRDAVLSGHTPVVFWDEFDSGDYKWLQYLLAPMQDGAFQEGRITHPIGKCVFVFAGGTSSTVEQFGPAPLADGDAATSTLPAEDLRALRHAHERFRLLKGPDFVSRLHGFLNILGPNPQAGADGGDRTYPLRRALVLRTLMGAGAKDVIEFDPGLLYALLTVPEYRHGARSFEKVVQALRVPGHATLSRSAMPAAALLERDLDARVLAASMTERDSFKTRVDIERLAEAAHDNYIKTTKAFGGTIQSHIDCPFGQLDADTQASNRSAVRRIPELLGLIDFRLEEAQAGTSEDRQTPLRAAIQRHLERLAKAEHIGWVQDRRASGWQHAEKRDNNRKLHPSMVEWVMLTNEEREKDRGSVLGMPEVIALSGYRAVG